jgi:hypothetical protein
LQARLGLDFYMGVHVGISFLGMSCLPATSQGGVVDQTGLRKPLGRQRPVRRLPV